MNKWMICLDLSYVTLSDDDILLLADALHQHSKILELRLTGSNSFQSPVFLQFLQKVFCVCSRSCLYRVAVDNRQYHPAMKQLESYQASRQQNGLLQKHLNICNLEAGFLPPLMVEVEATKNVEKSLLTGEY